MVDLSANASKTSDASNSATILPRHRARLMFDAAELCYDFGPQHPLQPSRLVALMDLLECSGLWQRENASTRLDLRSATLEELGLAHTQDFIAAVQHLSGADDGKLSANERKLRSNLALRYGFSASDTPPLPGMHEVSARIAGGTLVALSAVMGLPEGGSFASEPERPLHVFHPSGGLHHAWPERASGFCVYNDAAVAIAHVLRASEAKVLYIDFDVHHGDGVQHAFYDDPRVLTISLHETGRYLFPGTGDVLELGKGSGRGYSVNMPFEPFTEDDSYIETIDALLMPLVTSFAPDVIVSQHGCDTHAYDPLAHLDLTTRGILAQIKAAHMIAHAYCGGRWVALGGGGYDLYRVVPRAWSALWAEMSEQSLPERLPEVWVERWRPEWEAAHVQEAAAQEIMGKASTKADFPTLFLDRPEDFPAQARRWSVSRANQHTVARVRHLILPSHLRQAFRTARHRSPLSGLFDLLHLNKSSTPSRIKTLETKAGPILLRDFCPPSLVERLRPDHGLRAFARLPEREHQLLLGISKNLDCALTLAHTPAGEIVAQVTIAPADEWWDGVEQIYEVAIEVSANWRGLGIASNILAFALELDALEDMILFAMGLAWHWDIKGLNMSPFRYRELITHLFGTQGFVEYPTTEPNVIMEPANVLLARIGSRADERTVSQFMSKMLSTPNLAAS